MWESPVWEVVDSLKRGDVCGWGLGIDWSWGDKVGPRSTGFSMGFRGQSSDLSIVSAVVVVK